MGDSGFVLDPRLERTSVPVIELALSGVRLSRDANWPWLILVPRRSGAVELIDLTAQEQIQLMEEICRASQALRAETDCDKLNVAALGNEVAQLHVHVIARFRTDPAWPAPVWGKAVARSWPDDDSQAALVTRLAARLSTA